NMRIQDFVTRYPLPSALLLLPLTWITGPIARAILWLFAPNASEATQILVSVAAHALLAVILLTWLNCWRAVGFNGPSQWRSLYLLWVLPIPILLNLSSGIHVTGQSAIALYAAITILTGFSEEAIFRGIMLQTLLPFGAIGASAISALLFGLAHLSNLVAGFNPTVVLFQVASAIPLGFLFAALRLRTNTIWPMIATHALIDLAAFLTIGQMVTSRTVPPVAYLGILFFYVPLAAYGLFVLRKTRGPGAGLPAPRTPASA
ncbi:CPBP family intramembrane glutamic endopeptidase, partial [Nitrolancea hollandica]